MYELLFLMVVFVQFKSRNNINVIQMVSVVFWNDIAVGFNVKFQSKKEEKFTQEFFMLEALWSNREKPVSIALFLTKFCMVEFYG